MDLKHKEILWGRDEEENIVAVEPVWGEPSVELFIREDGELKTRYETYEYFLYGNSKEVKNQEGVKTQKLLGNNHYDTLVTSNDARTIYGLRKRLNDCLMPYLNSQYLLQSGKTLFKGMNFNDPLVMYFDLEVMTKDGYEFPNSTRPEDEIFIIAIRTNRDREMVLYTGEPIMDKFKDGVIYKNFPTEKLMIKHFITEVRKIDPDIIANHNIFNFDLEYLQDRCNLHDLKMNIGRNGSEPKTFTTNIKFADRSREYTNFAIYGRHVIDTQFLAEYADVVLRNMPSYRLKDLVKYLGKASDDRTYIPGEEISDTWKGRSESYTKKDLLAYAIDDVREAEVLYKEFGQSIFTLTQMIPMGYQEVFRYGTGNQVEYVFMREYLHQDWSYPKPDEHRKISGGYADVLQFGLIEGSIIYADVKSLYPSLATMLNIQPKKDELNIYQKILQLLIQTRYAIKAKIKEYQDEGNDEMVQQQKATDGSVKIFLNTMSYGFLAFGGSGFNDYDEAERITTNGQKIVKTMNDIIKKDGGLPIKVDTDGVALLMPKDWVGREEEYCDVRLTDALPDGIIIECDGMYDGILSFDRKSYALLEKDGEVKIKGNTLIGRSIESVFTDFTEDCILELFKGSGTCSELYDEYKQRLENKEIEPDKICKRANLNMTLDEYQNRTESGNTQTIAQYELALNATKPYTKGDVIKYYIKEFPYRVVPFRGKPRLKKVKLKNYEAAELLENYNYDYEKSYYFDRFDKIAKKFMALGKDKFEEIFDKKIYPKKADIRKYEDLTGLSWEIK